MPFEDVVAALGDREAIVITRRPAATFSEGVQIFEGEDTTINTSAVVEPMGAYQADQIDKEFSRDKTYKSFYTPTQLYGDDRITHGGLIFEILNLGDWMQHGGYCSAGCVAVAKLN